MKNENKLVEWEAFVDTIGIKRTDLKDKGLFYKYTDSLVKHFAVIQAYTDWKTVTSCKDWVHWQANDWTSHILKAVLNSQKGKDCDRNNKNKQKKKK